MDEAAAERELDASIGRLFHWAAYADKYGGEVKVSREDLLCGVSISSMQLGCSEKC